MGRGVAHLDRFYAAPVDHGPSGPRQGLASLRWAALDLQEVQLARQRSLRGDEAGSQRPLIDAFRATGWRQRLARPRSHFRANELQFNIPGDRSATVHVVESIDYQTKAIAVPVAE
jgi:hypothetical protein